MGTTGLDQQSLDQAVVLTSHPSESPGLAVVGHELHLVGLLVTDRI
jgi:hypothetical protein